MRRRDILKGIACGYTSLSGCAAPSGDADRSDRKTATHQTDKQLTSPIRDQKIPVQVVPVIPGLNSPTDIAFHQGKNGRMRYITDQSGELLLNRGGEILENPVFKFPVESEGIEQGLLGIALHPNFTDNRRFFVRYSAESREGTPKSYSHTEVLEEYRMEDDFSSVDQQSKTVILEVPQPKAHHNGGQIQFGPRGFLYAGFGDGGGDSGHSQNIQRNFLGSILRLDVDSRDGQATYSIPEDNPLVGRKGLDELYAWGFRNPWGISFDGSRLIVADVGMQSYEEVSIVQKGGNYGWPIKEGMSCRVPEHCPEKSEFGEPFLDPIIVYPHEITRRGGGGIIGGFIYRGRQVPQLQGKYIFGDVRGNLFAASEARPSGELWPINILDAGFENLPHRNIVSIDQGLDGEAYLFASNVYAEGSSAGLYKIEEPSGILDPII
jgi:glucose/arabinose dehydrogenase